MLYLLLIYQTNISTHEDKLAYKHVLNRNEINVFPKSHTWYFIEFIPSKSQRQLHIEIHIKSTNHKILEKQNKNELLWVDF